MQECIFCRIAGGQAPCWKIYENDQVLAFLDIHPMNRYHTLVIPKRHAVNIFDVEEEDLLAVMRVVHRLARHYRERLGIQDMQIINSSGSVAQQDVFHLHFHLAPRLPQDGQDVRWKTHPHLVQEYDAMALAAQLVDAESV